MRVALLGGGGFRTPLTYAALRRASAQFHIDELVLHDLDAGRLGRMRQVLEGFRIESPGSRLDVTATTDLRQAVRGAEFVLCAIRIGGLRARVVDERIPLENGVIGQETVGPGGLNLVFRSVPVMEEIARVVAEETPDAWFINFTNPVGVMCGVAREVIGERVVGVCDTPAGLCRRVAGLLNCLPGELWFDYFGLNHLGWLRSVRDRQWHDLLPDLLNDDVALAELAESRLFGADFLRGLGMLPSEYLTYFYYPERPLRALAASGRSRAEHLLPQQERFYAEQYATPGDALRAWHSVRAEREFTYMSEVRATASRHPEVDDGGEGYSGIAVALMESLASGRCTKAILNVANCGTLPFLPCGVVIEVPCMVTGGEVTTRPVDEVPDQSRVLMQRVSEAEAAAVLASRTGSRMHAIEAMELHPLVGSIALAQRLVSCYLEAQPDLAARLK